VSQSNVYSTRFIQSSNLGSELLATVPTGLTWIVKDITAVCVSPAAGATFFAVAPGIGLLTYVAATGSGPAIVHRWQGMQVLKAGEQLGMAASGATWTAMISGYQLNAA
jgi:hypothetical protein